MNTESGRCVWQEAVDGDSGASVAHWSTPRRPRITKRFGWWYLHTHGFVSSSGTRHPSQPSAVEAAESWRPCPARCTVPAGECPKRATR